MKTSELTGAALDWAVAKCEGLNIIGPDSDWIDALKGGQHYEKYGEPWAIPSYSTDWAQGGPIIEREGITITHMGEDWESPWKARKGDGHWQDKYNYGPTPLIAAMRCYVASKLGDEVDVPEELQ